MKNLIKLNETEMMVANVRITIYDVAKMYGIRHDNAMRDFRTELAKLDKDELKFHAPQIEELQINVKKGNRNGTQSILTKEVSLETAVWFFTKYDSSLRHKIVRYAFGKLHETTEKLENQNKKLETHNKKLNKTIANTLFKEKNGYMSVSKAKRELDIDYLTVSDIFDMLEENGDIETEIISVKRRKLTSNAGITDGAGNPIFTLNHIKQVVKKFN